MAARKGCRPYGMNPTIFDNEQPTRMGAGSICKRSPCVVRELAGNLSRQGLRNREANIVTFSEKVKPNPASAGFEMCHKPSGCRIGSYKAA